MLMLVQLLLIYPILHCISGVSSQGSDKHYTADSSWDQAQSQFARHLFGLILISERPQSKSKAVPLVRSMFTLACSQLCIESRFVTKIESGLKTVSLTGISTASSTLLCVLLTSANTKLVCLRLW